jgi:hypothetical protein
MNALARQEDIREIQTQKSFQPVLVDLEELKRIESKLENDIRNRFNTNTQHVFSRKAGKLQRKTMVAFINSGHKALDIRGRKSLLNEQDYTIRLEGLQRLEAIVEILTDRTGEFELVQNLNEITPGMISIKRAFIQQMRAYHKE